MADHNVFLTILNIILSSTLIHHKICLNNNRTLIKKYNQKTHTAQNKIFTNIFRTRNNDTPKIIKWNNNLTQDERFERILVNKRTKSAFDPIDWFFERKNDTQRIINLYKNFTKKERFQSILDKKRVKRVINPIDWYKYGGIRKDWYMYRRTRPLHTIDPETRESEKVHCTRTPYYDKPNVIDRPYCDSPDYLKSLYWHTEGFDQGKSPF